MSKFYHNPILGTLVLLLFTQIAFSSTAYTGGSSDGFASASTGGDVSLPIELSNWAAISDNGNVTLSWETESEIDNLGFTIMRRLESTNNSIEISSFNTNDDLLGQGSTTSRNEYSYIDKHVEVGQKYVYELSDMDYKGTVTKHSGLTITVRASDTNLKPVGFAIQATYPNPFNPSTMIKFSLKEAGNVSLSIFDIRGSEVETLIQNEHKASGETHITWDASDFDAGVYFCKLTQGSNVDTQKLMLLK